MGSGFSKRKKQARVMQEQIAKMQDEMKNAEAEGTAGGGLVTIRLKGENEIVSVKIKPECVDPEDVEGLEDLIMAAHRDAAKKLKDSGPDLSALMGGMPGDFGPLPS